MSAKTPKIEPIVLEAKAAKATTNYHKFKLPQKDKDDPDAPPPDETGVLFLLLSKYPQFGKVKKLKITVEPA